MSDERLKIAVFIDFDNIEIGVKSTLGSYFDIGAVLEAIKERGEIVTKVAYGDWTRAGDYGRAMSQHAVHMVQRNLTPGGDKNGADINLALDALEMAFTHNHINSFVIISGDSDFISLVEKLKQYDRKVFVVGGRAFTSVVMQKNCTEFIAYENVVGRGRSVERGGRSGGDTSLSQAMPLVRRALKLLADREVVPQLGLLKSTLLQLDSAFSEKEYGASSFRDFVQKLAKAGHVTLKGSERSFHVELRDGGEPSGAATTGAAGTPAAVAHHAPPAQATEPENGKHAAPPVAAAEREPPAEAAREPRLAPADVLPVIQQAFAQVTAPPRWPLYVRQIKQLVRAADASFDERRYGFSSLIDTMKFCQREGLFRIERDRQGIVRVWPGPQFQRSPESVMDVAAETVEPTAAAGTDGAVDLLPTEGHEPAAAVAATSAAKAAAQAEPQQDLLSAQDSTVDPAVHQGARAATGTEESIDEPFHSDAARQEDAEPAAPAATSGRRRRSASGSPSGSGTRRVTREPRAPRKSTARAPRTRKKTGSDE